MSKYSFFFKTGFLLVMASIMCAGFFTPQTTQASGLLNNFYAEKGERQAQDEEESAGEDENKIIETEHEGGDIEGFDDLEELKGISDAPEVEDFVREYFSDIPKLIDVARCESGYRQYLENGDVLRGFTNSSVIGLFQIHEDYHRETAKDLGFDIDTLAGNAQYGRRLYEKQGLLPWIDSSRCWAQPENVSSRLSSEKTPFTKTLRLGSKNTEVKRLQEVLNKGGFILTTHGAGSPGEETDYFGNLTRRAIQKFQCENDIVCKGSEFTTGYGLVNSQTRKVLNEVAKEEKESVASLKNTTSSLNRKTYNSQEDDKEEREEDSSGELEKKKAQLKKLQDQVESLRKQLAELL